MLWQITQPAPSARRIMRTSSASWAWTVPALASAAASMAVAIPFCMSLISFLSAMIDGRRGLRGH
jgi:hypothetical protein